ncbi:MAG: hypothetical protein Q8R13_06355 [bacterium]|nr:hypothetical protein [bacterium]MDZ4296238.1 hypothetical protein [Patescibacteria group bacterium]
MCHSRYNISNPERTAQRREARIWFGSDPVENERALQLARRLAHVRVVEIRKTESAESDIERRRPLLEVGGVRIAGLESIQEFVNVRRTADENG